MLLFNYFWDSNMKRLKYRDIGKLHLNIAILTILNELGGKTGYAILNIFDNDKHLPSTSPSALYNRLAKLEDKGDLESHSKPGEQVGPYLNKVYEITYRGMRNLAKMEKLELIARKPGFIKDVQKAIVSIGDSVEEVIAILELSEKHDVPFYHIAIAFSFLPPRNPPIPKFEMIGDMVVKVPNLNNKG